MAVWRVTRWGVAAAQVAAGTGRARRGRAVRECSRQGGAGGGGATDSLARLGRMGPPGPVGPSLRPRPGAGVTQRGSGCWRSTGRQDRPPGRRRRPVGLGWLWGGELPGGDSRPGAVAPRGAEAVDLRVAFRGQTLGFPDAPLRRGAHVWQRLEPGPAWSGGSLVSAEQLRLLGGSLTTGRRGSWSSGSRPARVAAARIPLCAGARARHRPP